MCHFYQNSLNTIISTWSVIQASHCCIWSCLCFLGQSSTMVCLTKCNVKQTNQVKNKQMFQLHPKPSLLNFKCETDLSQKNNLWECSSKSNQHGKNMVLLFVVLFNLFAYAITSAMFCQEALSVFYQIPAKSLPL